MAVQLLLVLLLEAEDDLNRARAGGDFAGFGNDYAGGIPVARGFVYE